MIAGDDVHHLSHNATTYDGRIVVALVPSSSRAQIESNEIHLPTAHLLSFRVAADTIKS